MSLTCIAELPLRETIGRDMAGDTGVLFVDFDYTLFGSNSTEMFIGSCKPAAVVALLDFLIGVCIPWRLFGAGHRYRFRDYARVVAILAVAPWNFLRWRRIAPHIYAKCEHGALANLLEATERARVVIVSFGFGFIIKSLLARSRFSRVQLLATPLMSTPASLRQGKCFRVRRVFDADAVAAAAFITDSTDDRDLLSSVDRPSLIRPYGDRYRAAQHLYLPLRYTASAKYPLFYTLDQFLLVDLAVAVIAVSGDWAALLHALILSPFFVLALMCIYEVGYFENDVRAAKAESNPTLTGKESGFAEYPIRVHAWLWSVALSAIGMLIAIRLGMIPRSSAVGLYFLWNAILVLLRLVFFCYNSISVLTRLYVYPFLQLLKYGSITTLLRPNTTGLILILAQTLTMYMIYVLYRLDGNRQAFPKDQVRLLIFVIAIAVIFIQPGLRPGSENFTLALSMTWLTFRIARTAFVQRYKKRHRAPLN